MKKSLIALSLVIPFSTMAHDIGQEHEHVEGGWNSKAGFVSDVDHTSRLWNPRGKTKEQILERVSYLSDFYVIKRTPEEDKRAKSAQEKYKDAIAINSVMPASVNPKMMMKEEHYHKGLRENKEAGMTLTSASLYNTDTIAANIEEIADLTDKSTAVFGVKKTTSVSDIRQAKKDGEMRVVYNTQGADYVVGDIAAKMEWSRDQGIMVMNSTYNNDNALAGGGTKGTSGLTEKGYEFVKQANKQGVVLDCSHASNQTCIDTANASTKPIVASHSNVKALFDHSRNLTDEAIIAIGEKGGAVCPTGAGGFLSPDGSAAPEIFTEHVVYVADLIGRDKVCFSTDAIHNVRDFYELVIPLADVYPPELGMAAPIENLHAENIWDVVAILEDKYNWNEKEIRGFLGENLMRVYESNWR